jgi:hypothetical protein
LDFGKARSLGHSVELFVFEIPLYTYRTAAIN